MASIPSSTASSDSVAKRNVDQALRAMGTSWEEFVGYHIAQGETWPAMSRILYARYGLAVSDKSLRKWAAGDLHEDAS